MLRMSKQLPPYIKALLLRFIFRNWYITTLYITVKSGFVVGVSSAVFFRNTYNQTDKEARAIQQPLYHLLNVSSEGTLRSTRLKDLKHLKLDGQRSCLSLSSRAFQIVYNVYWNDLLRYLKFICVWKLLLYVILSF